MNDLVTEPNPRWIRGQVGGRTIVDSRDSLFVWEVPYYPQWYFPMADIDAELRPNGEMSSSSNRGPATIYDIVIASPDQTETVIAGAAWRYLETPIAELQNRVRFDWDAIDRWLEEDVEVFVHPRSPYTRVDVLPSSRHVIVSIDGTVVADSQRSSILYETGLPPRYYLPKDDVRVELTPTETSSDCPYKGTARYWSVTIGGNEYSDIVWGYAQPLPESAGIEGLVCFYNEKVELEIDGQAIGQPNTKFS